MVVRGNSCGDNKHRMQHNDNPTKIEQVNSFVEKWALIIIVLIAYLFMSIMIIKLVSVPPVRNNPCGNGLFGALIMHVFLALITFPILALKLFISKKFPLIVSIIILTLVIIMPFITYSFF